MMKDELSRRIASPNRVRPVVPIEQQAKRDRTIGHFLAPLVVALIISGAALALMYNAAGAQGRGLIVLIVVIAGLATYLFIAAPIGRYRAHDPIPPAAPWTDLPPIAQRADESRSLSYQSRHAREPEPPPAHESLLALLGFIYGGSLVSAAFFWSQFGARTFWMALFAAVIPLGTTILFPRRRGFAAGMLIGIMLLLIAIPAGAVVLCAMSWKGV